MPPAFEKQTTWRRAMPITPRSGRIDRKCAIPTISARSEFARSTLAVRELGREEPVVGGFDCQLAHRRDPHVDRNCAKPAGLQCNAPGGDGRLGEAGPGLTPIPLEELVEPEIV